MPKYAIECHRDGDFVPTYWGVHEAATEKEAKCEAMLAMMLEQGQFEEAWNDGETDLVGYETIDGYVDTKEEAIEEAEAYAYIDSCVELVEGQCGQDPSVALSEAVSELLNNRQHLDLHPDDRRMLAASLEANRRWRDSRALHMDC